MIKMVLAMNRLFFSRNANLLVTALTVISFEIGYVSAQTTGQVLDRAGADAIESKQDFALFEPIEGSANRAASRTQRDSSASRAPASEPEFTLLGTSRIGDKYSVIIQHKGGKAIVVKVGPGASASIPEHGGYSIVTVAAGTVSIRYPNNTVCVEFSDRGVSCNESGDTADLTLAASKPLASSNRSLALSTQSDGASGGNPDTGPTDVVNPFAALREAQAENPADSSTSSGARFSPRRVAPEDVPPGMRVVSTPFGDRLVEQ
jgi:hypothetical protein